MPHLDESPSHGLAGGTSLRTSVRIAAWLVFTRVRREGIRPFKSIGSLHSQVPALSQSRSGNRHAPLALSPTEGVLQVSGNVAAQLSVAEILQFDRDSHPKAILSKTNCPTANVRVVPVRLTACRAEALSTYPK
ncbi:MAG: hypothetical protein JWO91_546 [Acidobacteriaceae bacterium]|nr:hypothetical protein [Acidobacteriaceae bacterium]